MTHIVYAMSIHAVIALKGPLGKMTEVEYVKMDFHRPVCPAPVTAKIIYVASASSTSLVIFVSKIP